MCYAGGPYCYGHSKERYDKAHAALKEKPTEANMKRFKEAVMQLDTTPQGIKSLKAKIAKETDADDREHYQKRLKVAQKTSGKQTQNKQAAVNLKKLNEAIDKVEAESTPTKTGHINLTPKQANKLAKAELGVAFPDTKFSVREEKAGFSSVMNVSYDNEELDPKEVRNMIGKYQGFSFNGHTDNYDSNGGFSLRGRSMSTYLHGIRVINTATKSGAFGPDDATSYHYPGFNKKNLENFNKHNNGHKTIDDVTDEDKNIVSKWTQNHDANGNYMYKNKDHVSDVVSHEGTLYQRVGSTSAGGGEYFAGEPYSFRVQVNKELTPEEADQLSNLTKYAYSTTGGEKSHHESTIQDSPNSIIVHLDTTKNRAYGRLDRFFTGIQDFSSQGTPARKDGSRAVPGIGGISNVEIYADDVMRFK